MRSLMFALVVPVLAAQSPLVPTSNTSIDVNPTQGLLNYTLIDVPAGVTVTLTGDYPVQIQCDGDVVVRGSLSVDSPVLNPLSPQLGGPGAVATGAGISGASYSWSSPLGALYCSSPSTYATAAAHAGQYGTVMPFSLDGGSPSGTQVSYFEFGTTGQCWPTIYAPGGGGGTLFVEAAGAISIHGSVTADGASGAEKGSGGSILLRAMGGLTVHAGGSVSAVAGGGGPNGIVRLDSYGVAPAISGAVTPAPTTVELPFLEEVQPPSIGTTWIIRAFAPRGDAVVLASSYQPGSFTLQPFGSVGIDVANAITLDVLQVPATGHDPFDVYQLAVPNSAALIGLNLFTAGLNVQSMQVPRFTNTLQSSV